MADIFLNQLGRMFNFEITDVSYISYELMHILFLFFLLILNGFLEMSLVGKQLSSKVFSFISVLLVHPDRR